MVISRQTHATYPPVADDLSLPSSYLKLFMEQLIQDPSDQAKLFEAAGFSIESLEQSMLPLNQICELIHELDQQLSPGWHVQPCLDLEPAQHGPLGLAMISASNVEDALRVIERFDHLRAPWARAHLYRKNQEQILEIRQRRALPDPAAKLLEMNLLALAGLIAQLLGPHRSELSIEVPSSDAALEQVLRKHLPGHVEMNSSRLALTLPARLLSLTCLLADPELHELMTHRCQRLLRDPREKTYSARVRTFLAEHGGRNPGMNETARHLGVSSRTLSRGLASEQTSYRKLIDESRLKIAQELLRFSRIPLADIALRLGYADPANFNRAYRRWTGKSPGQERRSWLEPPTAE